MTIATTINVKEYNGNGVTTSFAFPYLFYSETHLEVYLVDSDGAETLQALTTNYTTTGAALPAGGTIEMIVAPETGYTLLIKRVVPFTQLTDYVSGDAFPAESHERALDLLAMGLQQLSEISGRSIRVSGSEPVATVDATPNTVAGFDSNGDVSNILLSTIGADAVVPLVQAVQIADGVSAVFDTPATGSQVVESFMVFVNGAWRRPGTEFTYANGDITLTETPINGAEVVVMFFNPTTVVSAATTAANVTYNDTNVEVQLNATGNEYPTIALLKASTIHEIGDYASAWRNGVLVPVVAKALGTYTDGVNSQYEDVTYFEGAGVQWEAVFDEEVLVQQAGILTNSTDEKATFDKLLDFTATYNKTIVLDYGTIGYGGTLTLPKNTSIRGRAGSGTYARRSSIKHIAQASDEQFVKTILGENILDGGIKLVDFSLVADSFDLSGTALEFFDVLGGEVKGLSLLGTFARGAIVRGLQDCDFDDLKVANTSVNKGMEYGLKITTDGVVSTTTTFRNFYCSGVLTGAGGVVNGVVADSKSALDFVFENPTIESVSGRPWDIHKGAVITINDPYHENTPNSAAATPIFDVGTTEDINAGEPMQTRVNVNGGIVIGFPAGNTKLIASDNINAMNLNGVTWANIHTIITNTDTNPLGVTTFSGCNDYNDTTNFGTVARPRAIVWNPNNSIKTTTVVPDNVEASIHFQRPSAYLHAGQRHVNTDTSNSYVYVGGAWVSDKGQMTADRGATGGNVFASLIENVLMYESVLNSAVVLTLDTAVALAGDEIRVVRSGGGTGTIDVGGLKTIAASTNAWVLVKFNGTVWKLIGYGTL